MLIERWFVRVREGTTRVLSLLAQEDGYASEFAVVTALVVGGAVVVAGIIVGVGIAWAHGVKTK